MWQMQQMRRFIQLGEAPHRKFLSIADISEIQELSKDQIELVMVSGTRHKIDISLDKFTSEYLKIEQ
jgi:hypothetical protein